MKLPEIHKSNIESFLDKEEIIYETIQQIMKDFGMFGLEITFSGDTHQAYHEIHQQLTQQIDYLIVRDEGKLFSILYQVDISNKAIERTIQEIPEFTVVEAISHQVIERELKKVLTRRYFKSL
ncbi:MAG: hypothetical protein A2W95_15830 [Bacteroidetes bacterium GWA2_40_14]|jgi:predicted glycoside hydrolase/deacetylase ChbG (UPF0249 family)|nr:MAG: hypothetical protein A2W95_15830 [Bacteroidetes bacterium GWA2_40_14]